ncbi:MAG: hypothetical protein ACYDCO_27515 [Armatimonadota bacterium]
MSKNPDSDIPQILFDMENGDCQQVVTAIDDSISLIRLLASASVNALAQRTDCAYLIFERIGQFGTVIDKPLRALFENTADLETKIYAALLLIGIGSKASEQWLLDAIPTIEPVRGHLPLIVRGLRKYQVQLPELSGRIIARLRTDSALQKNLGQSFENNTEKDTVVLLLDTLLSLGVQLPNDLKKTYSNDKIPIEIRQIASKFR